ncbi:MAG: 4-(cytidine 5'-diphospho)-2-C-methyl-D-erythritol kinase [Candidatus Bipolaricaulota bacterium]|nr:4-(cytidine 5'-diphospho)-2-C-methyl-D-erythritol kinase [Candidatus Bipolaricaulota bacterium]
MSKTVRAFAKINLGLRVLQKRPDGYHEIETFFQSIDVHDTLTVEPLEEPEIQLEIVSPWALPQGRENLVYRAAERVLSLSPTRAGVRVRLEKRIPIGAGLGGGSSDAAATLVGLNELLQLRLSDAQLRRLALELGSDVPYFLVGGLCRGRGRGEILEKLPSPWGEHIFLLVKPDCSLSTEAVYREYARLMPTLTPIPSPLGGRGEIGVRGKGGGAGIDCTNDLEEAALRLCPQLRELRHIIKGLKPDLWGMSGSGPTYYAIWRSPAQTELAIHGLAQQGYTVFSARPTTKGYELVEGAESR